MLCGAARLVFILQQFDNLAHFGKVMNGPCVTNKRAGKNRRDIRCDLSLTWTPGHCHDCHSSAMLCCAQ